MNKIKFHLYLLVVNDSATPQELMKLGYSFSTAYLYCRRAKKEVKENYYTERKRLRELREKPRNIKSENKELNE